MASQYCKNTLPKRYLEVRLSQLAWPGPAKPDQMTPNVFPTAANVSAARNSSSRLCVALTIARNLALPSATVGNPTAGANTPASNNCFENANALGASPTWIGTIGVSLT